jgi:hypothetical protein
VNTSSSSESRLTVTRRRPASRSACAFCGRSDPFVVSVRSRPSIVAQLLDQPLEVATDERLAAGNPDLFDAVGDERVREPLDLLEGEELRRSRKR